MSLEREVTHVGKGGTKSITLTEGKESAKKVAEDKKASGEETPFEQLTLEERKARIARVLERGMLADRLHIELPGDLHGEWVPKDVKEVEYKKALGFKIDHDFAARQALHSEGDGAAHVGDVVFMTCPKDVYTMIKEIKRKRFEEMHGKKKGDKYVGQAEERQFTSQTKSQLGMPIIDASESREASAEEIESAVRGE